MTLRREGVALSRLSKGTNLAIPELYAKTR